MAAIDTFRRTDLEGLIRELRRSARTIRAETLVEREATIRGLTAALDAGLEAHADADEQGLEALARVHIWRETGLPLVPPEPRPPADV